MGKTTEKIGQKYASIITTILLAMFAVFWTLIDRQLSGLDARLRSIEQQTASIQTALNIHTGGQTASQAGKRGGTYGPPLDERP